jgi:HPt (histidine-containing phosphotransfer) domain-containing protein
MGAIDLAYLERLYKGDRVRMEQWITFYLEEAPPLFARLKVSLEHDDAPNLIAAAHDLRPQAHYLGTPQLLELLIAIGERTRTDGASSCTGLVNEVLALGEVLAEELRAAIAPDAGRKPV